MKLGTRLATASAWLLAATSACVLAACAGGFDPARIAAGLTPSLGSDLPKLREKTTPGLPAPQALRATSGQLREIPLRWDPLLDPEVGGYALERATERAGPFQQLAALAGRNATVYVDRGPVRWPGSAERGAELSDGETHFYRVRAFDRNGQLGTRSVIVAASTAPAPDPPAGLRAWSHRPRLVPLGWEPSSDVHAAGYALERSPTAEGPFQVIARISDRWQTSWVDEDLGDLRVFYYRITAVNDAGGLGEATQPVRAVTKPGPLPPIGLRVVARGLGATQLGWEPNVEEDLAGYRLMRLRGESAKPEPVAQLGHDALIAVDPEVGPGERVSYLLVALDRDGLQSAPSQPVEVESEGYELTATLRPDGIHLAWEARADEGFTRARVFLEGVFNSRELAVVEGPRWVHSDVQPGKRYRYHVVLERADGTAAPPSRLVEVGVPERRSSWLPGQDSNLRPSG